MLSAILSVGRINPQRKDALSLMLSAIGNQSSSDYELIVVEQYVDTMEYSSTLNEAPIPCTYIAVQADDYSTPWGFNIGAKNSSGETLVFINADILFAEDYFAQILEQFQGEYSFGWDNLIKLNPEGTAQYREHRLYKTDWADEFVERRQEPHPLGGAGLSTVYNRDFLFEKVGGWNESFTFNKGNDNDMAIRTLWAAGDLEPMRWNTMKHCMLHLYHAGRQTGDGTREILAFTEAHPGFVCEKIIEAGWGIPAGRRPLDLGVLRKEMVG